jgi:CelD/BcsL family acetyltransferase involved in cellulose biosynthesis
MRTTVIDPLVDARWSGLFDRSPEPSPFHHPAWLGLIGRTYGYEIRAWAVEDGAGRLLGGMPVAKVSSRLTGRRLVSLPFSDLCPLLLAGGSGSDVAAALLERVAADHREQGLDVELRCESPTQDPDADRGPDRFWHHVVVLGGDLGAVESGFTSAIRRGIKKARREGVTVRRAVDGAGLDAFYRLHQHTRRRLGVPTQPKRFIRGFERLFERGLGSVMLAELAGEPIAAAVFLRAGDTTLYKYGASDAAHLAARPNNLLMYEAIRQACLEGSTRFDMGRTDIGHEGLRAFKRSWGAEEHALAYMRFSHRPARTRRGAGGIPPAAGRLITASPPIVSRVVGEALYRHFG